MNEFEEARRQATGFASMLREDAEDYLRHLLSAEKLSAAPVCVLWFARSPSDIEAVYTTLSECLTDKVVLPNRQRILQQVAGGGELDFVFPCTWEASSEDVGKLLDTGINEVANHISGLEIPRGDSEYIWSGGLGISVSAAHSAVFRAEMQTIRLDTFFAKQIKETPAFIA